ncbi:MAG: hypothetical protein V1787_02175 [Candidatus Micrarchaeota archaeon]
MAGKRAKEGAGNGLKKPVRWTLAAATLAYLASGLGKTNSQEVTAATLGLLTKPLAFQLHSWLFWPFVILLAAPVVLAWRK